jgi:hypothetical protein
MSAISWNIYNSVLEMDQPVGLFQTFNVNGVLVINDPGYFAGGINAALSNASVQLPDLTATSLAMSITSSASSTGRPTSASIIW